MVIWIEVRLDRALASQSWVDAFLSARLSNLHFSSLDHCPILLEPVINRTFAGTKSFRFENAWLREPVCTQIVKDCWAIDASIQGKIHHCGEILAAWGKEVTGNFKIKIATCKSKLKRLKGRKDEDGLRKYEETEKDFFEILTKREVFWKQRSKQLWLKEGDHNNLMARYFTALFSASATDCSDVVNCIERFVTIEMNTELLSPVSEEEVRLSLF
ncbi:uncharacterized protein LOC133799478 [Humulus lupulus]|uniref:uncharacterized protein LOC133799478 n=1 Tax=Humulus lupulus TaxID=3486 RepID=UPI002B40B828|nr:uncharacterized protein LOC133799478 [Humulus lupulus]